MLLIPDEVRMKDYSDNLIGGLAMHVIGPPLARLLLNAFVVVVGFLILAGAVNTAIIGSNGVLNRVAEDGVMPDWFLKPHRRYGTTLPRALPDRRPATGRRSSLSRGNMYVLGEAYAFGVVWSFVFKALAMVVLRFKDRSPREFKVPLNIRIRGVEVPIGLIADLPDPAGHGRAELADQGGGHDRRRGLHGRLPRRSSWSPSTITRRSAARPPTSTWSNSTSGRPRSSTPRVLGLTKPYRKLVAIRSSQNLFMLEKALVGDRSRDDRRGRDDGQAGPAAATRRSSQHDFDHYDRELMTAVVNSGRERSASRCSR